VDGHRRRGCAAAAVAWLRRDARRGKAAFAETWRKWLALNGAAEDQGARVIEKSK
jgi:hypothetical protein